MSDYESTQTRRNMIVGVFVVIALSALAWLTYRFGDLPIKVSEYNSFNLLVQFPTAQGLQKSTPVKFCGYQIGRVTLIDSPRILKDLDTGLLYHQALATLSINKKYDNIPDNSKVKLITRGLGSSYVEVITDPRAPSNTFFKNNSKVQGGKGSANEFIPEETQKKLEELVVNLGKFINHANDIIGDPENKTNLKQTLANLTTATQQAADTLKEFQELSASAKHTVKGFDDKMEQIFPYLLITTEQLSKRVTEAKLLMDKLDSGSGTAARFLNDGKLYEELLESTRQLNMLLTEMTAFMEKAKEKGVPIKLK